MISYIFKSKFKNCIIITSTFIYLLLQLKELHRYLMFYPSFEYVAPELFSLMPSLLVFIYMINLKREYKFKNWLLPISFAIFTLTTIFSITNCFNEYTLLSLKGLVLIFVNLIIKLVMITGHAFCFVGTLSNFKRIIFLRLGLPICIITISVQKATFLINFLLSNRAANNLLNNLMGNEFFTSVSILSEPPRICILLLFYISFFILTLTKKSDNIDISPFIEARKLKKEAKKARKLANQAPDDFTPPAVANGYWRCMGCGEILPNDKSVCECGYKR